MDSKISEKLPLNSKLPILFEEEWAADVLSDDDVDYGERIGKEIEDMLDGSVYKNQQDIAKEMKDDLTKSFMVRIPKGEKEKKLLKDLDYLQSQSEMFKKKEFLITTEEFLNRKISHSPTVKANKKMVKSYPPLFRLKDDE